ncbi:hypothetical protein BDZ90DRAFT_127264 [Jaminaea rosea]|uniref:Uncharacterized protein n=1 Tax=Jaminaea rosea TaxID=1569628 RepID=A0A316UHG2_9BASI|nr:hypothetical protein BDZ90DRAFT_127264 [Jaminaea rosea]PWN24344.1 hypothetical protein BDZ90DRAFT_127264 [Jaminaea rosea]
MGIDILRKGQYLTHPFSSARASSSRSAALPSELLDEVVQWALLQDEHDLASRSETCTPLRAEALYASSKSIQRRVSCLLRDSTSFAKLSRYRQVKEIARYLADVEKWSNHGPHVIYPWPLHNGQASDFLEALIGLASTNRLLRPALSISTFLPGSEQRQRGQRLPQLLAPMSQERRSKNFLRAGARLPPYVCSTFWAIMPPEQELRRCLHRFLLLATPSDALPTLDEMWFFAASIACWAALSSDGADQEIGRVLAKSTRRGNVGETKFQEPPWAREIVVHMKWAAQDFVRHGNERLGST